jgi:hypothetical protein
LLVTGHGLEHLSVPLAPYLVPVLCIILCTVHELLLGTGLVTIALILVIGSIPKPVHILRCIVLLNLSPLCDSVSVPAALGSSRKHGCRDHDEGNQGADCDFTEHTFSLLFVPAQDAIFFPGGAGPANEVDLG